MIPSAARLLERIFGAVLGPGAASLRALALLALLLLLVKSIVQAVQAIRARRHGWETATVVRGRTCGALATDPSEPRCPEGHAVRFPAGAATIEGRKRARRTGKSATARRPDRRLLLAATGSILILLLVLAGARSGRILDFRAPALAAASGALAFLFLSAALGLGLRVVSPVPRTSLDRVISFFAGAIALAPALIFLALCRTADPPPPCAIGSLWTTPSALYCASPGGRGRRVTSPAPPSVEVEVVKARSALFPLSWLGVARLSAGGSDLAWSGSGGTAARFLGRLPAHGLEPLISVEHTRQHVETPANVRVWIVRDDDRITFEPEAGGAPSFDAVHH